MTRSTETICVSTSVAWRTSQLRVPVRLGDRERERLRVSGGKCGEEPGSVAPQSVRDAHTSQSAGDGPTGKHSQQRRQHDHAIANGLEANGQPAVGCGEAEVRPLVGIEPAEVGVHKRRLHAVGAESGSEQGV